MANDGDRRLDMLEYHFRKRRLMSCYDFSVKLGISMAAFKEIIDQGIGPSWKPALVIDAHGTNAWFSRDMLGTWRHWIRKVAAIEDLVRMKEIVIRHDKLERYRDLATFDELDAHTYFLFLLELTT